MLLADWGFDGRKDKQLLLVCPEGSESVHFTACGLEADFYDNREYVDAVSPRDYLKSKCPSSKFISATADFTKPMWRKTGWADHPVKVVITFTGKCVQP